MKLFSRNWGQVQSQQVQHLGPLLSPREPISAAGSGGSTVGDHHVNNLGTLGTKPLKNIEAKFTKRRTDHC